MKLRFAHSLLAAAATLSACGSDDKAPADTAPADSTPGDSAPQSEVDAVEEVDAQDDADALAEVDQDTGGDSSGDTVDTVDTLLDTADSAEVETVVVGACATDSPAGLAGCVERARYEADLATVAVARPTWTPAWEATRDLCATRLGELGFTVERHTYGLGTNVIGTRLGKTQPDHLVLVGAHYDSIPQCPGADDNGSGVAGVLEVARVLAQAEHDRTLVVACWDEEERGLIGSIAAATRMSRAGSRVVANFNFEMIGYYSDEPNTQQFPQGFEFIFPEAAAAVTANENRGDFITNIGGDDAGPQLDALAKYGRALGLPTVSLALNKDLRSSPFLADLRRSDHAAFWAHGYPAIMLTDGANFRNSAYHCGSGPDAIARLDPVRASKVVAATVGAAAEALQVSTTSVGTSGVPRACDVDLQDCGGATPKCSIVDNGFGMLANGCVPEAAVTVGKGASCTRGAGGVGDDNCAPGLFCALFGKPQGNPQERQCLPLCDASATCAEGERCVRWGGALLDAGVCVPTCDPFDPQACGAGLACAYEWLELNDQSLVASCDWAGAAKAEAACNSVDCEAGLACVADLDSGLRVCRALCDADHACAGDARCVPYRSTGAAVGRGTCVP